MKQKRLLIIVVSLASLLFPLTSVHAYIDPGSGSYIIQVLLGVLFGAIYFVGASWDRIRTFLFRPRKKK